VKRTSRRLTRHQTLFLAFLSFSFFSNSALAQDPRGTQSSPPLPAVPPVPLPQLFESYDLEFPAVPDTVTPPREKKSTVKAMLFSAALPGLGQIYTKSYWKLPIIWGLGGYYVREWIRNNNRYRDYRDQYSRSITPSNPSGDLQTKAFRDFYRNQRDSFAWYFGILYLANIVDAYVSASLYEFDVSDDLSFAIGESGQVLTLRWRW